MRRDEAKRARRKARKAKANAHADGGPFFRFTITPSGRAAMDARNEDTDAARRALGDGDER